MKLSMEKVRSILNEAFEGPRVHPSVRLAAAVVDHSGHVVAAMRELDAPPLLLNIAESKAKSCIPSACRLAPSWI